MFGDLDSFKNQNHIVNSEDYINNSRRNESVFELLILSNITVQAPMRTQETVQTPELIIPCSENSLVGRVKFVEELTVVEI